MTQNRRHIMGIDSGVRNSRPQNGSWVYPESARNNPECDFILGDITLKSGFCHPLQVFILGIILGYVHSWCDYGYNAPVFWAVILVVQYSNECGIVFNEMNVQMFWKVYSIGVLCSLLS